MGNMYCKGQITLTPEGKENYDKIRWNEEEEIEDGQEETCDSCQTVCEKPKID